MLKYSIAILALSMTLIYTQLIHAQERFAGIEIGSKNVKYVIVEVTNENNERKLVKSEKPEESKNPDLVAGTGNTQRFNPEKIKLTADLVKSLHDKIMQQNVSSEKIMIFGSSGISDADGRDDFIEAVRQATGKTIKFISHEEEAGYTFLGVVPKQERDHAYSIDIGSGNTKWGYMTSANGGWEPQAAQIRYASRTFTDEIAGQTKFSQEADYSVSVAEFFDSLKENRLSMVEQLGKEVAKVDLTGREKKVYLSGGLLWSLTTIMMPQNILENEVHFTADDVKAFSQRLKTPLDNIFQMPEDLPEIAKVKANEELQKVKKVFASYEITKGKSYPVPHAQLICGTDILLAMIEKLNLDQADLIFIRDSQDAWLKNILLVNADVKISQNMNNNIQNPYPNNQVMNPNQDKILANMELMKKSLQEKQDEIDSLNKKMVDVVRSQGELAKEQKNLSKIQTESNNSINSISSNITDMSSKMNDMNSQVSELRKTANTPTPFNGDMSSLNDERMMTVAFNLFYASMSEYHNGNSKTAHEMICKAQQISDKVEYWYARAIYESSLGMNAEMLTSVSYVSRALKQDKSSYNALCKHFELVQGHNRINVENALKEFKYKLQ